ncbi:FMRFamide-related peptides-like [Teleopsis dalmanni]|uniref:FMRFamide-related peptides-like n=1 Tax=Teleopsis dalmanni TaxID=139649 RepID=UPI0018CE6A60|nr:FMRFamide-related peptides-like [Teleopsis dalmanni]
MLHLLIFLLSIYQLQSFSFSEIIDNPKSNVLDESDDYNSLLTPEIPFDPLDSSESVEESNVPIIKSARDQTEVAFLQPISAVNIDYAKNSIILKFRKDRPKLRMKLLSEEAEKRRALENNFMRFGRTPNADFMRFGRNPADFMRFGKRQIEEYPTANSHESKNYKEGNERAERSTQRDSRGDNFMRFGRVPTTDFIRFGRNPADFMRFGRSGADNFMRLGRNPADFMRFGRNPKQNFIRFGRNQKSYIDKNFMRYGRPDNFMRFGRTPPEPADNSANFMRFGKMDQNFMRFGKSVNTPDNSNNTKVMLQKNEIKEAAKILHQADKSAIDETNPMDKAISVLFNKQKQQEQQQQKNSDEIEDMDLDSDYIVNK